MFTMRVAQSDFAAEDILSFPKDFAFLARHSSENLRDPRGPMSGRLPLMLTGLAGHS